MTTSFKLTARARSFRYAFRGILVMLKSQHNAWIHLAATIAVLAIAAALRIDAAGWCGLVLAIMAVWTAEALNTALEILADVTSPDFHPMIGQAKDVAAGAVLISAVGAVVIGLLVLGPPLLAWSTGL